MQKHVVFAAFLGKHLADVAKDAVAAVLHQIKNAFESLCPTVIGIRDIVTFVPGAERGEAMDLALAVGWTKFLQNLEVTVVERQDQIEPFEVVGMHLPCAQRGEVVAALTCVRLRPLIRRLTHVVIMGSR